MAVVIGSGVDGRWVGAAGGSLVNGRWMSTGYGRWHGLWNLVTVHRIQSTPAGVNTLQTQDISALVQVSYGHFGTKEDTSAPGQVQVRVTESQCVITVLTNYLNIIVNCKLLVHHCMIMQSVITSKAN